MDPSSLALDFGAKECRPRLEKGSSEIVPSEKPSKSESESR